MIQRYLTYSGLLVLILATFVSQAMASSFHTKTSKRDLQIIGKALSFIEGGPSGDIMLDIIYDSSDPTSLADANDVAALFSSGLKSGKLTLRGEKASGTPNTKVAYIAKGAETKAAALSQKGIITVSANPDCAISEQCVLGVSTTPKVEIHVSTAAASAAGVSFASIFRMMIREH